MTSLRHTRLRALGLTLALTVFVSACDSLSVDPYSQIPADQFFQNEEEVLAALAPIYANLRFLTTNNGYHGVTQVASDETIVPTRGTDWGDGGAWLQLHLHTWDAGQPFLNDVWNTASVGIARSNGVLSSLETATIGNRDVIAAEVRALRAFYYYVLMDMFGRAPLIGDEPGEFLPDPQNPPPAAERAELFAFIEAELNAAAAVLPAKQTQSGRIGADGCNAILANMYLNAQVFGGSVTAAGLQRGPARWQDAFDKANALITSGRYQLSSDWFSIFSPANSENSEHIFAVQALPVNGLGLSWANRALHYNSTNVGAWNGFSALADSYNAFDTADPRREAFLIGPQVNLITGEPVNDRQGNRLNFTLTFDRRTNPAVEDVTDAADYAGVRPNKFTPDPNEAGGNHGNDYPFFRLGEMYLIRAEAAFELGQTGSALADLNTLRSRVGAPQLTSVNRETILLERMFEMNYEARRRQDLIRANESIETSSPSTPRGSGNLFTRAWQFKTAGQPNRLVFPIPQPQLNANPNLTQNAGY